MQYTRVTAQQQRQHLVDRLASLELEHWRLTCRAKEVQSVINGPAGTDDALHAQSTAEAARLAGDLAVIDAAHAALEGELAAMDAAVSAPAETATNAQPDSTVSGATVTPGS